MDFITQAHALAEEIYQMTSALTLTGQPNRAEPEVDAYAALMDMREPMVAKLTQLLKQNTSLDKDKRQPVDNVILKIIELDKEHRRIMEHLRKSVKDSLREARSGQRLNQAYAHPYDSMLHGLLDAKQ
jgi:t-SNARE complex subunit (syntaxin)